MQQNTTVFETQRLTIGQLAAEDAILKPARIGIIGDVHCEDQLLEKALDFLAARRVDCILCTGDIPDGLGSIERSCELLQKHQVAVVGGNHERWLLSSTMRELPNTTPSEQITPSVLAFLQGLPKTMTIDSHKGLILLCHGMGQNDMSCVKPDDFGYALECNAELQELQQSQMNYVINGHTHRRMVRKIGRLTINPEKRPSSVLFHC